ncbi:UNVERIFIED_CONTAM: hypothetical protein RMT77_002061 [Armadillidium vulgare]
MASALRLSRTFNFKNLKLLKQYSVFPQVQAVYIHTSKKSKDSTSGLVDTLSETKPGVKPEEPISYRTPKNWVSFGFSDEDIVEDTTWCHVVFFLLVSCSFCIWTFNLMYAPDNRMMDWVKRESYIELRRREAAGLPLVDKNLIPLENIELPTDEELGDAEIII